MKIDQLKRIVNKMKETPGTNDKIEILKAIINSKNSEFFRLAFQCYNKFIQFNIKKISPVTPINNNEEIGDDFFNLLNQLSSRTITGNTAINFTKKVLSNYDKETQKILIDIIKKNMKLGVSETTINKVLGSKHKYSIPVFKVQLANALKFDKIKKYLGKQYLVSEKMDGIRAIGMNDGQGTINLFKRSGKTAEHMEKIVDELNILNKEYYKKYGVEIGYIDGELFTENIHFNEIISAVSKTKNTNTSITDKISFTIFATDLQDYEAEITDELLERFDEYKEIIKKHKLTSLHFVDYKLIEIPKNEQKAKQFIIDLNGEYTERGYEGIMFRDIYKPYDWKRSDALLKFKHFFEGDFRVIDVEEGQGNFENSLGALVCEGIVDNKKVNFKVGSGFKEEERNIIYNNQNNIIGKTIEVKYQEVCSDVNGKYSLRFPVFLKIKADR